MNTEQMKNLNISKKHSRVWIWVLCIILAFVGGIFIGQASDLQNNLFNETGDVDIKKVINLYSKTRSSEVNFDQFWTIWDKVKEKHVDRPISDVDLFYGALEGMVAGLDDPYSVYLPPQEAMEFAKDLAGEFEGIGAEIGVRDGQLQVIAPLPSSPAETAGLKPGDKIFAIDGEDAYGLTLEEAVLKIRGEKGTTVTLTVTQNGFETIRDVEIIRDTITVPTVHWEKLEDDIIYLRISYFNSETWNEFDSAVKEIINELPKGIVLDLRSNPGGFLETSVDVASEWVESGLIVSEGQPDNGSKKYLSRGRHRLDGIKTVVLVDGGTASGSEIVAGALQDYKVATIIGTQTFGKGSVQEFEALPDGSALKLTVAKWYTPEGRGIDEEGIAPDVIVEEMFSEVLNENGDVVDYEDAGLKKAVELLEK